MAQEKFTIGKNARNDEGGSEQQPSSGRGNRNSWNTVQPEPKQATPFSTSLTLRFALTAIMTAVILVIVLAIVWGGQFSSYTRQRLQSAADAAAETLSEAYVESGEWTTDVILHATVVESFSDEIGVQIVDADGSVLYDSSWNPAYELEEEDAGTSEEDSKSTDADDADADAADAAEGTDDIERTSEAPNSASSMVAADIVDAEGDVVGTVKLWALGSDALLTTADSAFRTNSYGAVATAAIIAALLACVIGFFTSRSISKPIQRITSTAKQVRNGDLTARSGVTGTDEIGQLGETFDDMTTSLERDIKLEHRLTGDVAHELRTPLQAILATVEAMQDGVLPADDEHLETVASEVRHLSRLIDAMLKLSRLENGTTELKVERTDVVLLVNSLVNSQHQLFHEKGLHLRFVDETSHGECYADIDPDMIREAAVNLMSNAMRYTNEGGWVKVSVAQDHSDVLISVQDTGIGIAKEDIPQTFSRFWRSDVSRERVSGGLGVGLSITKEIVDRHNGTISVESELGKGTTFTLRIPMTRKKRKQT